MKNKNLRMYEALAHEVATDAAARGDLTPELSALSSELLAYARGRLADYERVDRCSKVPASIRAMNRPSVLARLGELLAGQPRIVFAHRDFQRMTDDDLRSALADAESLLQGTVQGDKV
jgi:hypothetical protein